jgi:hypothetical protein
MENLRIRLQPVPTENDGQIHDRYRINSLI